MFGKNKKKTSEKEEELVRIRELEKENKKLYSELTNKNQDYFFQLDSRLDELSYEKSKKIVVMNQLLQETTKFQKDAITARKMYGTVTEQVEKILELGPGGFGEKKEVSPILHLYLDGALLLGGLFSVINGVTALFSPSDGINLLQLILNFVLGGLAVLVLQKYKPDSGTGKAIFKYSLITVAVMLVWIFTMEFVDLLAPAVINPPVQATYAMGAGLIGVVARSYLKNRLNITGSLF